MRRLLRVWLFLAGCLLLAEAVPGCADSELNPQPLPPGKEDERGSSNDPEPPSAGGEFADAGAVVGDAADGGSLKDQDGDAGDGGDER